MKTVNTTYPTIRKITAFLLLFAILIPTVLQAKQLAEFCMPDHHGDMGKMTDHSCCQPLPEETGTDNHQQHDCDEASLCTCNISEKATGKEEFVQPVKKIILQPSITELQTPLFSSNQPSRPHVQISPAGSDIPLWLMFDTFLM